MAFKGYIYETTNLIDGRKYVGKRETLKDIDTYLGSGKILKLAIKKYGRESFKKRVLCFYDSKKELGDAEKYFIAVYRHFYSDMYNIADGGEGGSHPAWNKGKPGINKGKKYTEETKAKMSASHKGKQYRLGKHNSEETKRKQSESMKGNKNPMYGKKQSEEIIGKRVEKIKGKKRTEETKIKMMKSQPNSKQVLQYDLNGNFIREWESIGQAAKELNVNRVLIGRCCNGVAHTAGSFIWKLK